MSNFKKLVQARMAKTGESWSTAAGHVRTQAAGGSRPPNGPPTDLALLLAELFVTSTFPVLTGRSLAIGRSAVLAAAMEQARRIAENPTWYASTGAVDMTITHAQHELLLRHGAALDTEIQVIRTSGDNTIVGYSDRCRGCHRWIWCGGEEVQDTCVCGQAYRITMDLAEIYRGSVREGAFCMDCGHPGHPSSWVTGRWRLVSPAQVQCDVCQAKEGSGGANAVPATAFSTVEISVDGAAGPTHFSGECPKCNAPMTGVLPAGKSAIDFQCDKCGGTFVARRRNHLQEELIAEALGPTMCNGCGIEPEKVVFLDGRSFCEPCAAKREPVLAASRKITPQPS